MGQMIQAKSKNPMDAGICKLAQAGLVKLNHTTPSVNCCIANKKGTAPRNFSSGSLDALHVTTPMVPITADAVKLAVAEKHIQN